jgi:hypothetical protein
MSARFCDCGTPLAYRQRRCAECRKAATYARQRRWYLSQYVAPEPRGVTICSVADCNTKAHARGWCTKHWNRWRRTGDPLGLRQNGRPVKGEAPGYDAAHRRISRTMGTAKGFACVDCGNRADEWSYNGGDPDELITDPATRHETAGLRYSLDAAYYSPRCVRCHRAMDGSTSAPRERDRQGRFTVEVIA